MHRCPAFQIGIRGDVRRGRAEPTLPACFRLSRRVGAATGRCCLTPESPPRSRPRSRTTGRALNANALGNSELLSRRRQRMVLHAEHPLWHRVVTLRRKVTRKACESRALTSANGLLPFILAKQLFDRSFARLHLHHAFSVCDEMLDYSRLFMGFVISDTIKQRTSIH